MNRAILFILSAAVAANACAAGQTLAKIDLSGLDASKAIAGMVAAGNPAPYVNRGALYAFNGAGMSADGLTHGTTADNTMFMLSSNNSGSFPWYIQVDLGATQRIDAVRIYNFNFARNGNSYTSRGVRNFNLYVSTDSVWPMRVLMCKTRTASVMSWKESLSPVAMAHCPPASAHRRDTVPSRSSAS